MRLQVVLLVCAGALAYSMPCRPAGRTFPFDDTNNNSGAAWGSFAGFGHWSKDAADATPRLASVPICTSVQREYQAAGQAHTVELIAHGRHDNHQAN